MFKRKVYQKLKYWKDTYKGSYSALIQGARRVGKSTIAQEFAKNEYKSFIIIDFANISKNLLNIFDDISNLDLFFLRLQTEMNIRLYERDSVIIFDEIQLYPKARQYMKYLVEDHRYDYIETGSLISIKKNVKDIVIPSEEYKIDMFPMDYEEFLDATNNPNYQSIKEILKLDRSIGDKTNQKLMKDFRLYMAVGGMPQAVKAYVEKKDFNTIDEIKREIIELYKEDFHKIDNSGRISKIFEDIPSQLALKKKRFMISEAIKTRKKISDEERLSDLIDSKTIQICYNVTNPSISLSQTKNDSEYKLYITDTGLFTTLLFNDESKINEDIYKKLLSDKLNENLGFLYENAVAQILSTNGHKLYYHSWKKENSSHSYEIDFIIKKNDKLIPIEVKSSRINPHESLDVFDKKYHKKIYQKWLTCQKDINKIDDINIWPIYCLPVLVNDDD